MADSAVWRRSCPVSSLVLGGIEGPKRNGLDEVVDREPVEIFLGVDFGEVSLSRWTFSVGREVACLPPPIPSG